MNRLIAIAVLAGALSACEQDPRNLTITEENQDSFMEELAYATLTVEEVGLLTAAQMRRALATGFGAEEPVLIGKTVGDVIEEERTFRAAANARQAEEDRLAAEAKAAADALVAELRQAITLTVFDKGFRPSDALNGRFEDLIPHSGRVREHVREGHPCVSRSRAVRRSLRSRDIHVEPHDL